MSWEYYITQRNKFPVLFFYYQGLTLIPEWISNYIHYRVWDEITYPFLTFTNCTIEVWEWISNFIPQFPGHVISYPCRDLSWTIIVKGTTGAIYKLYLFRPELITRECEHRWWLLLPTLFARYFFVLFWKDNHVIMSAMASQITGILIVFQAQNKENINTPRHWPL